MKTAQQFDAGVDKSNFGSATGVASAPPLTAATQFFTPPQLEGHRSATDSGKSLIRKDSDLFAAITDCNIYAAKSDASSSTIDMLVTLSRLFPGKMKAMNVKLFRPSVATMRGTFAALALTAACATSWALPTFTVSPAAAGLHGTSGAVVADSFTFATVSTVTRTSATTFSETGYLSVQSLSFDGETLSTPGLNAADGTGYGLYIAFTGSGTVTQINSTTSAGEFTTLNYTLYGYNGDPARFGFSGNTPMVTGIIGPLITLVTGSGTGEVATVRNVPSANALVEVNLTSAGNQFFQSPSPFYTQAETSFISTASALSAFTEGFRITQGGGSFNFIPQVSEPTTYVLMLAGVGAVGFVARRRRTH